MKTTSTNRISKMNMRQIVFAELERSQWQKVIALLSAALFVVIRRSTSQGLRLVTRRCFRAVCMVGVVAALSLCMTRLASAQQSEIKLTAADAAAFDLFGRSVAISGNTAIVGAYYDDDAGSRSGSAYLFDATTGNQLAKLTAADAAEEDYFGVSVAISGNTAIVGAQRNDDAGNNSGSAYLFDVTTGDQLVKLTAADAAEGDWFGISVAISGNTAIVGAFRNDDAGSAYLFDVTTGNQLAKLTAADAAADDRFGSSVAISGNTAIVGAYGNRDTGFQSGSAYLFDVTSGNQLAKLTAADAAASNRFGSSVAISGNTAIVGAHNNVDAGFQGGSAYLFVTVPEPTALTLTALGLIGLVARGRRRRAR